MYTVGIAEMKVVAERDSQLITHALGSCLGVTIHDSVAGVSGMIHIMLPLSKVDPAKAAARPAMFVDTGIPELFEAAYRLGAKKTRIVLKVAGGAEILDQNGRFKIGQRNYSMLRKLLWKNSVLIEAEEVGGTNSRTMILDTTNGVVTIRSQGNSWNL